MKGLIVNNFYLIKGDLKLNILISLVFTVSYIISQKDIMILMALLFIMIIIPGTTFNIERKSELSNWNMIEAKLPIKRGKIILSRYIAFLIVSVFAYMAVQIFAYIIINEHINHIFSIAGFKRISFSEMIKIYLLTSHLMCIIYYPIMYLIGPQKNDAILILSIIVTLPILNTVNKFEMPIICIIFLFLYFISYKCSFFIRFKFRHGEKGRL